MPKSFPYLANDENIPWWIRMFPDWVVDRPWESFIGVLGTISAIPLIMGIRPPSIDASLPGWLQLSWAVMLLIGCITMLWGVATRKPAIERLGLQIFGPPALVYGIVVASVVGADGVFALGPYVMFFFVSSIQAYKLRRLLLSRSKLAEEMAQRPPEES